MRREETRQAGHEGGFALVREEGVAGCAEEQRDDEQDGSADQIGEHREQRRGSGLGDRSPPGWFAPRHEQIKHRRCDREQQRSVLHRFGPAGKRHHSPGSDMTRGEPPKSMFFAASAAPAVISRQAATTAGVGSAKPKPISTTVDSSGAA